MKNCETGCFALCAGGGRIIVELESLNAETNHLITAINKIFKELGV